MLLRFSVGQRLNVSPVSSCKQAHLLGAFRILEQPQQNKVRCGTPTCPVRGLSRVARFSGDFAVLLPQFILGHRYCCEAAQRHSSKIGQKEFWHFLNPGYRTTAVGCRHILCLFRQEQVKAPLVEPTLHSAEYQWYNQFCRVA